MAHRRLSFFWFSGALWLAACSLNANSELADGDYPGTGATGTGATGGTGTGGTGGQPPEVENEESYTAPVVSGRWIWSANPLSGKVALIDAGSLRVTTASAGVAPTYVAALGESTKTESSAIVLNVGNDTASLLHAVDGEISVDTVKVHPGANRMTVSATGRWALVWSDAALVTAPDPTEGLQDVTVLDLGYPPVSYPLTVGYRPSRVTFGDEEEFAYFVTEPGISVLELPTGEPPRITRDIPVATDPTEAASVRDVTVTPDGHVAIIRRVNQASVRVVSLDSGEDVTVTLPGAVTDLDLAPTGDVAYAVVRGPSAASGTGGSGGQSAGGTGGTGGNGTSGSADAGEAGTPGLGGEGGEAGASNGGKAAGVGGNAATGGTNAAGTGGASSAGGGGASASGGTGGAPASTNSLVARLELARIFDDPTRFELAEIEDEVGSIVVAPESGLALLYTNATPSDHLTIFDTRAFKVVRTVLVQAPVRAVLPSPDGIHAVAVLGQAANSKKLGGFSLVALTTKLPPKIVGTDAPTQAVALGTEQGLITVEGKDATGAKVHAVYLAQLPDFGTKKIELASPPIAAGLVGSVARGFVAQSHPEGRITFLELVTGQPRTITGYELAARVVQGE